MHDGGVAPLAELAADFFLDADEFETVLRMQAHARLLGVGDAGEHGVEAVSGRPLDERIDQRVSDAASLVVLMDVDRVLDRGAVRRSRSIEAEARESGDHAVVVRHQHGEATGSLGDVGPLFVEFSRDEVERRCRLEHRSVVDLEDRVRVVEIGGSDLHEQEAMRRRRVRRGIGSQISWGTGEGLLVLFAIGSVSPPRWTTIARSSFAKPTAQPTMRGSSVITMV